MRLRHPSARSVYLCGALLSASTAAAQGSLGSLKTEGVEVAGTVAVSAGRATINGSGTVSTNTHAVEVALTRGGAVEVCTGSSASLSQSTTGVAHPPLLVALNRGAIELRTAASKTDVVITPDFRFELSDAAPLDLRIRLVPNGDTCVENAGKNAPMLHVTEAFGTGAYFVRPGQRVLFEHGSLREVVDHESSSCGCPRADATVLAGNGKRGDGKVTEAARNNPFPEAESQGLVKPAVPQASPDETHVQVNSTLNYSGATNTVTGPPGQTTGAASPIQTAANPSPANATPNVAAPPTTAAAAQQQTHVESATPPPKGPNPFRALGRFFRRVFGGKSSTSR